jgi:hypothetical protein
VGSLNDFVIGNSAVLPPFSAEMARKKALPGGGGGAIIAN